MNDLILQTITGDALPTGPGAAYLLDIHTPDSTSDTMDKMTVFFLDGLGNLKYIQIAAADFPPASFSLADCLTFSTTIPDGATGLVFPSVANAFFGVYTMAYLVGSTFTVPGHTGLANHRYAISQNNIVYGMGGSSTMQQITWWFGGNDAGLPTGKITGLDLYDNTVYVHNVLDPNKFTIVDGLATCKSFVQFANSLYSYVLFNESGECAQLHFNESDPSIAPGVMYFNVNVPTGGKALAILARNWLWGEVPVSGAFMYYLVERADGTIWLYNVDNNGTALMQLPYTDFNPELASSFTMLL